VDVVDSIISQNRLDVTTLPRMAMGIRDGEQSPVWVVTADLPKSPGHPFYVRLNALLDAHDFDRFVEKKCRRFYASVMGRPSLTPGRYFRLLLLGYFEGIDAERGIVNGTHERRELLPDTPQSPQYLSGSRGSRREAPQHPSGCADPQESQEPHARYERFDPHRRQAESFRSVA
jgi:hypothetical protein